MQKQDTKKTIAQKDELKRVKDLEYLLKRLQADFDNYRKRVESQQIEIRKSANTNLILRLLPVLDNFKRASRHLPQDANWAVGIKAIEKQFEEILDQAGLELIEANHGDHIDPNKHEVIAQEKIEGSQPGTIIRQDQAGYTLYGKVLRPTKVVVAG